MEAAPGEGQGCGAPPSEGGASAAAHPSVAPPPAAAASEPSLGSAAQLSAASGSLAGPNSGLSSRLAAHASLSMRPPRESSGAEAAAQPSSSAAPGDAGEGMAAQGIATAADEATEGAAEAGEGGGGDRCSTHHPPPAVRFAAPTEPAETGAEEGASASSGPPSEGSGSSSSTPSDSPASDSPPPPAASPSRLSVAQLLKARELAAAAAGGGASPERTPPSAHSPPPPPVCSLPASPSQGRLASCRSSPSLSPRRRSPGAAGAAATPSSRPGTARAEASAASSAGSHGSLASGHSTLLRPTASFVAGVQEMRSRKEQCQLRGQPSTYQPQVTAQQPFKLTTDERAKTEHTCSNDAFKQTREEREAAEIQAGQQSLAADLRGARERCRRTLSVQPLRPTRSPPHEPVFKEFSLQGVARHAAYVQSFKEKIAEEQRQEDALHSSPSHGSRPSSRIGALHGSGGASGGSPPQLATQERATRHSELSAERRQREEAAAAATEAERLAQLSVAEREEEAERAAHRFKARPMPDFFSKPVFSPDKHKAKPSTVVREFRFSTRVGAAAAGGAQEAHSGSRLRSEGSGASV